MGQDPNQPYGQYGQPQPGGYPPQQGYQPPQQPGAYPPPPDSGYPPPGTGYPPPNTGYQYQQPYGQAGQLYNTADPLGATTISMEPKTAAGLSYLTWIAGLIFFLMEKQNRFVRFHAMQEILLTAAYVIVEIVLSIVFSILTAVSATLACITAPLTGLIGLGFFVLWLICMINAFQGKYYKLPLIGDYAERWSAPSGAPRM